MTTEVLTGLLMLIVMLGAIFIGIQISFTLLFLALTFGYMSLAAWCSTWPTSRPSA